MVLALIFSIAWFMSHIFVVVDPNWTTYLLNGGPFAIVVFLIIIDKLTTPGERDRLRIENEALKKQIAELNDSLTKEVLPVLTQLNILMTQTVEALRNTAKGRRHEI